jgi:uncharacterized membrane protein YeaQ/YmgE (transglycosylase-associated protein family)
LHRDPRAVSEGRTGRALRIEGPNLGFDFRIVTILIGIVGAIVGGFLGKFVGLGSVESFDLGGIFIATVGSIILLIIYRLVMKNKTT